MKVLVTGGAGYIGSTLVGFLLADGYEVTVLDNFSYNQTSLAHLCSNPKLQIVRGDGRDMRVMKPLVADADVFIPLAALVGAPLCEARFQDAWGINCYAVQDTLKLMSPAQNVIIPISNSGYGIGDDKECTETSPLKPVSIYGQTKVRVEEIVMSRGNAVSLRLATVFGMSPRMRMDLLVNAFVWQALRDRVIVLFEGHFRRNYIHVRDVGMTFVRTLDLFDKMKDQVYNVGLSDANLTKKELCIEIWRHVPELEILDAPTGTDPDKRDYIVSNAKLEATGWRPCYSLEFGIKELIRGYQMLRVYEHGNV